MLGHTGTFISCCARRSRVEQLLPILAVVFTIQIGLVSTVLGKSERGKVCVTPGCVEAAARVRADMDQNVEPCVNFYDFACGGFVHKAIAENQDIERTTSVEDDIDSQLYDIIDQPVRETEAPPMRVVKRFFRSCMNLTQIARLGFQPLSDRMESMGGWPTVKGDTWNETDWTWQRAIVDIRKLGLGPDYILGTKNQDGYWEIDQPSLGIIRSYLIKGWDENAVRNYYKKMVGRAVLFGANRQRSELDMREVLDFEIALANITIPSEEFRNFSEKNQHFILQEADKRFPFVGGFRKYFKELSPDSDGDSVLINVPVFFDCLGQLLARTPKRTIANFLFWRIISFFEEFIFISELSALDSQKLVTSIANQRKRGIRCVNVLKQYYPKTTESLYVRNQFNASKDLVVKEMLEQIQKQSIHTIKNAKWMDQKTRIRVLKKLTAMRFHIGSPIEQLLDANEYEYNQLKQIDNDYYFESALSIRRLYGSKIPDNAIMQGYNLPYENSVTISAGYLHERLFTIDRPRYMNFGSVGTTISHEIMHGFDDHGIQYDDNKELGTNWLKPETRTTYLDKIQCIIDQYGNYTEKRTGLKLNGINTQGENFADNAGFKLTYEAYQAWVRDHQPEQALPGLPYTQNQLFWIAQAQFWCEHTQPENLKVQIFDDVHSPAVFRILGTLRNIPAFANDFNCPISSPMNPIRKCVIF